MEFEDYLDFYSKTINDLINYNFDYIENKDYIRGTAYILFYKLCTLAENYEEDWLSYMIEKQFYDVLFKTVLKNIYMLDYCDRVNLSKRIVFLNTHKDATKPSIEEISELYGISKKQSYEILSYSSGEFQNELPHDLKILRRKKIK